MMYAIMKACHVISIICWMAGLLYLPRLFVYHTQVPVGSERDKLLQVMERRLLRFIMNPAMISSWGFGLWLMIESGAWRTSGWLHTKLLLVMLLSGFHGVCARWRRMFACGQNLHTTVFFRIANEVPTLLMIGIVVLVFIKTL